VWTVDLDAKKVHVYRPGHEVITLGDKDTLEGFDVLPGLKLSLAELFAEVEDA